MKVRHAGSLLVFVMVLISASILRAAPSEIGGERWNRSWENGGSFECCMMENFNARYCSNVTSFREDQSSACENAANVAYENQAWRLHVLLRKRACDLDHSYCDGFRASLQHDEKYRLPPTEFIVFRQQLGDVCLAGEGTHTENTIGRYCNQVAFLFLTKEPIDERAVARLNKKACDYGYVVACDTDEDAEKAQQEYDDRRRSDQAEQAARIQESREQAVREAAEPKWGDVVVEGLQQAGQGDLIQDELNRQMRQYDRAREQDDRSGRHHDAPSHGRDHPRESSPPPEREPSSPEPRTTYSPSTSPSAFPPESPPATQVPETPSTAGPTTAAPCISTNDCLRIDRWLDDSGYCRTNGRGTLDVLPVLKNACSRTIACKVCGVYASGNIADCKTWTFSPDVSLGGWATDLTWCDATNVTWWCYEDQDGRPMDHCLGKHP